MGSPVAGSLLFQQEVDAQTKMAALTAGLDEAADMPDLPARQRLLLQHTPLPSTLITLVLQYAHYMVRDNVVGWAVELMVQKGCSQFYCHELPQIFCGEGLNEYELDYLVILCSLLKERNWCIKAPRKTIHSLRQYRLPHLSIHYGFNLSIRQKGTRTIVQDNVTLQVSGESDFVVLKNGNGNRTITQTRTAALLNDPPPQPPTTRKRRRTEMELLSS